MISGRPVQVEVDMGIDSLAGKIVVGSRAVIFRIVKKPLDPGQALHLLRKSGGRNIVVDQTIGGADRTNVVTRIFAAFSSELVFHFGFDGNRKFFQHRFGDRGIEKRRYQHVTERLCIVEAATILVDIVDQLVA